MNDERIEQLLRKGPALKTPEGLLEKLQQDARAPRMEMGRATWTPAPSWFQRWLPALAFTAILMVCLVAIGVQTNMLADLRRQNESLTAATQNLDALRAQNDALQKLSRQSGELDRLRKDNAELLKLRDEVAQLQGQVQEAAKLRAANQALQAGAPASAADNTNADFFAESQAKAERINCVNHLKQLGLAVRIWEGDNNGVTPPDLISMTNEMNTWSILQCPSDKSRTVSSWADVAAGNVSYQYLVPGISESADPRTVLFICPIHHNVGLLDGSVQQLSAEAMANDIKEVNGRKILSQ